MILKQGWWKTADGKRLVPDGHPDAAILAYPKFTEMPDGTAAQLGIPTDAGLPPTAKPVSEVESLRAENETLRVQLTEVRQVLADRDAQLAEAVDELAKAKARPADKARAKPADK